MVNIEDIKSEAASRMETLRIDMTAQKEFIKHNRVYKSEFLGALYPLSDEEKVMVEKFEKNTMCLFIM